MIQDNSVFIMSFFSERSLLLELSAMEMRSFLAEPEEGDRVHLELVGDRSTAGFYDLAKRMFSTPASAIAISTGNPIHTMAESIDKLK